MGSYKAQGCGVGKGFLFLSVKVQGNELKPLEYIVAFNFVNHKKDTVQDFMVTERAGELFH